MLLLFLLGKQSSFQLCALFLHDTVKYIAPSVRTVCCGCMDAYRKACAAAEAQKDYVNTSSGVFSSLLNCTALCLHICCSLDDRTEKHRKCQSSEILSGLYYLNQSLFWERTVIVPSSQGESTQQPLR